MGPELWVTGPNIEIKLFGVRGKPRTLDAIIDTGASATCLDQRIAQELGLTESNRKIMQLADGSETIATGYRAIMEIKGLGFHDWVEVFGINMATPSTRVLLGRAFLRRYIVNYNGPDETFHFFNASAGPVFNYLEEYDG